MMSQPIDLSKTPEFAIEETRRQALFPPQAQVEITLDDGTCAYWVVTPDEAERLERVLTKEIGRQPNIMT
jgi:hypothetical protein